MEQMEVDSRETTRIIFPAESCLKYPLQALPPNSVVSYHNRSWTVGENGRIMGPAPNDFPNWTTAQVPTTVLVPVTHMVEFIKLGDGWKRKPSGGVNVQVTDEIITGQHVGEEFRKVRQPAKYHGGGKIDQNETLAPIDFGIPFATAKDGAFIGSEAKHAFEFEDPNKKPSKDRKMSILVQVNLSTGKSATYQSKQHNIWKNGESVVTKGALAMHAIEAMASLMDQERERGAPLCINNLEIHPDDLLLVSLVHISKGTLQAEIAVRKFS